MEQRYTCRKCNIVFHGFGHSQTNFERYRDVSKGTAATANKRKHGPMFKYFSKVFVQYDSANVDVQSL